jgi:hypothetical protein
MAWTLYGDTTGTLQVYNACKAIPRPYSGNAQAIPRPFPYHKSGRDNQDIHKMADTFKVFLRHYAASFT